MVKSLKAAARTRDKKTTKRGGGKGILSNRQTRNQAKKGKSMIAANVKNGHAHPATLVNDWSIASEPKFKGERNQSLLGVTEYLTEVRSRALKGKSPAVTPLANAIRNAYKSAKAGEQEKAILARIEAARPAPTAQEIARALVASGIPALRAGKVAMGWDSKAAPGNLARFLEEGDPDPKATARIEAQLMDQPAQEAKRGRPTAGEWEDLGRLFAGQDDGDVIAFFAIVFVAARKTREEILIAVLRGMAPTLERVDSLLLGLPPAERAAIRSRFLQETPAGRVVEWGRIIDVLGEMFSTTPAPSLESRAKARAAVRREFTLASAVKVIWDHAAERYAAVLSYLRLIRPLPLVEDIKRILGLLPEQDRMVLAQQYRDSLRSQEPREAREIFDRLHQAKAEAPEGEAAPTPLVDATFGPDPIDRAESLFEVELKDYHAREAVKRAFDTAAPDRIAEETGATLARVLHPFRATGGIQLLTEAGIPESWFIKILVGAEIAKREEDGDTGGELADRAEGMAELKGEVRAMLLNRKDAPAAGRGQAGAPDPFGEALKTIIDSGYGVSMEGKTLNLRGIPSWKRQGVHFSPEETKKVRAQVNVMVAIMDGVILPMSANGRDYREARKLGALTGQFERLLQILDPLLKGEGGKE